MAGFVNGVQPTVRASSRQSKPDRGEQVVPTWSGIYIWGIKVWCENNSHPSANHESENEYRDGLPSRSYSFPSDFESYQSHTSGGRGEIDRLRRVNSYITSIGVTSRIVMVRTVHMVTMTLARSKKSQLRELGWSTVRRTAERPSTIPANDVLQVGEDVVILASNEERHLFGLDDNR